MRPRTRGTRLAAERVGRIEEVYHEAREQPRSDRGAFLLTTCGDDQDLIQEVSSLLQLEDTEGLLEKPVLELAAQFLDEPAEAQLAPGAMVGPYQILERIGAGGMGEVFKANDTRLGRTVALKVVDPRFSEHSPLEARAIAALNHPNICTLYDVGPNYMVLELLEGETLAQVLRRGPLPAGAAVTYGAQIADALSCAHSAGITHGDLKPRNLMLTKAGLKVLDFGLARFAPAPGETAKGAGQPPLPALGTPAYMSPEQLSGSPCDLRTDIFALGLVLFEMATGQRPFPGTNRAELTDSILKTEPKLDRLSPPHFAHIVERCLAKNPEDRWQTARDVKLELDYAARAVPKPALRAKVRRRWWVLLAAALLTAVLAPIAYFRLNRPEVAIAPLTSYPGSEEDPSFSPDGNQIAFSWNGPEQNNRDIYVKQVGASDPLRLTTDPRGDEMPRWSPDGKWIAFLRREPADTTGVYVIPALGGLERRLRAIPRNGRFRQCLDWSPDGAWLVISSPPAEGKAPALALLSFDTGEVRPLTSPVAPQYDFGAQFAPDGSAIAFLRENEGLMLLSLSTGWAPLGRPAKLALDVPVPIRSVAWTADSRELILAAGLGPSSLLWRADASGPRGARRLPFGESATGAAIARAGNRLAFSRFDSEYHIWSLELDKAGRPTGPAVIAFNSTRSEVSPAFSPDGARVAFTSNRSGNDEIWVCLSNAANCAQLTTMDGAHAGSPAWSPDGNWIAFDVNHPNTWEVNVIPSSGGKPTRLASGLMPRWSHDGKWIYFLGAFGGPTLRVAASGGTPEQVIKGAFAQESPDGRWLYWIDNPEAPGQANLKRKLLTGAAGEEVLPVVTGRNYLPAATGAWFLSPGVRQESSQLEFFQFATRTSTTVYQTARPVHAGLTISPDGRRVLFTQVDRSPNVDLILAEHFR